MQTNNSLLIRNGRIATLGQAGQILNDHGLLIESGVIAKIAPIETFKNHQGSELDAKGKLVLPGLINSHMHFYSTFARGLYKAAPSKNFNEVLKNLWWKLDKKLTLEDTYYSALIALIECIKKGTTTVIDHHASPGAIRGSLSEIAKAVELTGLRASLCYEVSDRDGEKAAHDGIIENQEFLAECNRRSAHGDDRLRGLFGLHASFTLSEKTLNLAVDKARVLGAGFHVHVAEAASDQEHCLTAHGTSIVERFNQLGITGEHSIFAHCVHVSPAEMDLLAETNTKVVHNPQSNMNNAVGMANIVEMALRGVQVGLGTDAMTCNMFEELRVAMWLQKLRSKNPSVGFTEVMDTLFFNNPKIAGLYWKNKLGHLVEGAAADVIIVDYDPPTPLDSHSLLGHLCFGVAEASVDTTIAGGTILMKNKVLQIKVDEEQIAAHSRELARRIWKDF